MEAAGLAVGVVGFGLQLATTLQVYIEGVAGVDDRLRELSFDVASTASTLKQLQDMLEADKAAVAANESAALDQNNNDTQNPTIFAAEGIRDIQSLSRRAEKVYKGIIRIIVRASSPASSRSKEFATNIGMSDLSVTRLTQLGRDLKWPWLEPRVKKCQDELRWLKMDLLLHLSIAALAKSRLVKPSQQADVDNPDDEAAIETVADRLIALRAVYRKTALEGRKTKEVPSGDTTKPMTPAIDTPLLGVYGIEDTPRTQDGERDESWHLNALPTRVKNSTGHIEEPEPIPQGLLSAAQAFPPSFPQSPPSDPSSHQRKPSSVCHPDLTPEETAPPVSRSSSPSEEVETIRDTEHTHTASVHERREPDKLQGAHNSRSLSKRLHRLWSRNATRDSKETDLDEFHAIEAWVLRMEGYYYEPLPFDRTRLEERVRKARRDSRLSVWDQFQSLTATQRGYVLAAINETSQLDARVRSYLSHEIRNLKLGNHQNHQNDTVVYLGVSEEEELVYVTDAVKRTWQLPHGIFYDWSNVLSHIRRLHVGINRPHLQRMIQNGDFDLCAESRIFVPSDSCQHLVKPGARLEIVLRPESHDTTAAQVPWPRTVDSSPLPLAGVCCMKSAGSESASVPILNELGELDWALGDAFDLEAPLNNVHYPSNDGPPAFPANPQLLGRSMSRTDSRTEDTRTYSGAEEEDFFGFDDERDDEPGQPDDGNQSRELDVEELLDRWTNAGKRHAATSAL
ncbi:hypothetical protein FZEAL_6887 [Fusarium zealandicum]|uniref:Ubiquitin-like domain-containing protein n=1 Tax=Fusarium zealandicum TaxID=1053134 RepID=A0A8H4UHW6_9HYPO|nr:hypothetical protein FZEAL_6887 [Fusarium zealandicum]